MALAVLATIGSAHATMVHDLDSVPAALHTPEAREVFGEQMAGTPATDTLGTPLPTGLSAQALAALLVPKGEGAPLGSVGAKPWAAMPGTFVALVCTGGSGTDKSGAEGCSGDRDSDPPLAAYLGIVTLPTGAAPKLVAPAVKVDPAVSWDNSLLPNAPEAVEDNDPTDSTAPSTYDRLDLTPFHIAPGVIAFGLRASWSDGYAGGFGWHSALYLYAIVDGALRQVLAVPVLALTDFAGDWNKDGTRQHEIQEGANVLVVTGHAEAGYFDILVRNRLTRRTRLFRWDAAAKGYRATQG